MTDFSRFGHPSAEWLAFEKSASFPPPAPPNGSMTPEAMQSFVNAGREKVARAQMQAEGLHEKVSIEESSVPARDGQIIPIRIYRPKSISAAAAINGSTASVKLPLYVFYHGGGFTYGTLNTEDAGCSRIAASSLPTLVISICYRHTPQVAWPVPQNDAFDAFDWIIANLSALNADPAKVVVGGVSAGANLAATVVLRANSKTSALKERPKGTSLEISPVKIRGQILVIPWLVLDPSVAPLELMSSREKCSRVQCWDAPVLSKKGLEAFAKMLKLGEAKTKKGAKASVGVGLADAAAAVEGSREDEEGEEFNDAVGLATEADVVGLPKTAFLIAGNDPLRDDGLLYARTLHRARVHVKVHVFPGLPHGFRRFNELASSRRWDELVVENIRWVLGNQQQMVSGSSEEIEINVENPFTN